MVSILSSTFDRFRVGDTWNYNAIEKTAKQIASNIQELSKTELEELLKRYPNPNEFLNFLQACKKVELNLGWTDLYLQILSFSNSLEKVL